MRSPTDLSPLFANRFTVHVRNTDVRLAFAEQVSSGQEDNYHSAVVLSTNDAKALRDLLIKVLA